MAENNSDSLDITSIMSNEEALAKAREALGNPAASNEDIKDYILNHSADFKTFLESGDTPPKDERQKPEDEKTLNVDEVSKEGEGREDPAWKKEVNEAFVKANEFHNGSFARDPEAEATAPETLPYKNDQDHNIVFHSKNDARVEGDFESFRILAQTAVNMDMNSVKFGKFEEHPEYKVMLYAACLEKGLEMKGDNVPSLEEIKQLADQYPEATRAAMDKIKEIKQNDYDAATKNLDKARKDFWEEIQKPESELGKNFEALKVEKAKGENADKDEIARIEGEIKKDPKGMALNDAVEKKANLMREGIELGFITEEQQNKMQAMVDKEAPKIQTAENTKEGADNRQNRANLNHGVNQALLSRVLSGHGER